MLKWLANFSTQDQRPFVKTRFNFLALDSTFTSEIFAWRLSIRQVLRFILSVKCVRRTAIQDGTEGTGKRTGVAWDETTQLHSTASTFSPFLYSFQHIFLEYRTITEQRKYEKQTSPWLHNTFAATTLMLDIASITVHIYAGAV